MVAGDVLLVHRTPVPDSAAGHKRHVTEVCVSGHQGEDEVVCLVASGGMHTGALGLELLSTGAASGGRARSSISGYNPVTHDALTHVNEQLG